MSWLRSLFSSKKFVVMVSSIVTYVAARVGLDVSASDANNVATLAAAYIVGQGLADHGKEAEKLKRKLPESK